MEQYKEILQKKLEYSFEKLCVELAKESSSNSFGISEQNQEHLEQIGRHLFNQHLGILATKLCPNEKIKIIFAREARYNEIEIAAIIIDTLLICNVNTPILTLTAMILKYGLKRLCNYV